MSSTDDLPYYCDECAFICKTNKITCEKCGCTFCCERCRDKHMKIEHGQREEDSGA